MDNKSSRIFKNSVMLSIRMLLIMLTTLYTSRVIIDALGIKDYGIYNVVAGFVTMFAFVNGAMTTTTQRYLNYYQGIGLNNKLNTVFCTSMNIHIIMALIVVLLAETIGLWFLYEKLVIDEDRFNAAFWVYQFSVISCVFLIVSIPYNAVIISHEKMNIYAYISIFDVILRLIVALVVKWVSFDKLVAYGFFLLLVQMLLVLAYRKICLYRFAEAKYHLRMNRNLMREMFHFAGWNIFGDFSYIIYTQGLNIVMNIFFGPLINAARGVSIQVQSALRSFFSNFQVAMDPQITKSYAEGDTLYFKKLLFSGSKVTFIILMLLVIPVYFNIGLLLDIWLVSIPDHSVPFIKITIFTILFDAISHPFSTAIASTGNVKMYKLIIGICLISIIPVSYVCLTIKNVPEYALIVQLVITALTFLIRLRLMNRLLNFPISEYLRYVIAPTLFAFAVIFGVCELLNFFLTNGYLYLAGTILVDVIFVPFLAYVIMLDNTEKDFLRYKYLHFRKVCLKKDH